MAWRIKFNPHAQDELTRLDKAVQKRIIKFLEERLQKTENPREIGAPLRGDLKGLWKYRTGNYRLICKIQDDLIEILVLAVGHRRGIYK